MRPLPPLAQLRAFEAAARHRSFKLAAAELSVTPAAISHQVRQLEAHLGLALFERHTRRVEPTAAALSLYPVLRAGFDAFAEALAALAPPRALGVTLAVTPAFAAHWLLPRLPQFQQRHPNIELRILASTTIVDLAHGGADLAVRYGGRAEADLDSRELVGDRFLPVTSPRLKLHSRSGLSAQRLIHFDWQRPAADRPTWARWLREAGLRHGDARGGLRFSEESHAIQAAVAGHGVALLSHTLVQDELARGVLTSPFGPDLDGPCWRLVRPRDSAGAATQSVWDWLVDAFAGPREVDATRTRSSR